MQAFRFQFACQIEGEIADDPMQIGPRLQNWSSFIAGLSISGREPQPRFLHHILSLMPVADETVRMVEQSPAMFHEYLDCRAVVRHRRRHPDQYRPRFRRSDHSLRIIRNIISGVFLISQSALETGSSRLIEALAFQTLTGFDSGNAVWRKDEDTA